MVHVAGPTAALAGVPAGLQAQGVWAGRRQLFIRFAAEAETATMYTADALANEIRRSTGRSVFHSLSISGRDPLSNVEYLQAAFTRHAPPLPVLLDVDGQRPEAIGDVKEFVTVVQVTIDGTAAIADDAHVERALETIRASAVAGVQHALVLCPGDQTSDPQLLRVVEQAHRASADGSVVIQAPAGATVDRDRRWIILVERSAALHRDVRFALRIPPPTGMR